MTVDVSVLCLVKGRHKALENLLSGLSASTKLPDEFILVLMNEEARELPKTPFPVEQVILNHRMPLPLAAARNLASKHARGRLLIFLDVDCIPAPDLIERYRAADSDGHLLNGEVRYLSEGVTDRKGFLSDLDALSKADPIRAGLESLPYELFWSLNFACTAKDYRKIGGFDASFTGYGAEDTDFAFMARRAGIRMKKVSALAYHQYHIDYAPPVNHLADIVANARIFYSKWGKWPMEGWLKEFKKLGLIYWDDQSLKMLRMPDEEELLQSRKS
ncbi:galactosyltransferase-related protein [Pedobacter rhodius]|uniref:Galactosyltransferase-related protein n=1 Tax=Pedobacter rhodius TaxID=3004098 RepID=A0ABT4KWD1_9SPHI|nr:galactosyltransferase-related protein [Pedobacter sp. SJ11]MCZ4222542.1 galactosyltransferase-related protein [Pedobacter sp. SJ11]